MSESFRHVEVRPWRVAILVAGMHRSGTSAATRVINLLGAEMPGNLMPPHIDFNAKGYWESLDIVRLNDELLESAMSSWDDVLAMDISRFPKTTLGEYRRKLSCILDSNFQRSDFFVIKDPRLSRLLDVWLPTLNEWGAEPRLVIVVRNPMEVAESLRRRENFSVEKSLLLWLRYMLEVIIGARGCLASFLCYDDLLLDWRGAMGRVARDLDIAWLDNQATIGPAVDEFLDESLRHCVSVGVTNPTPGLFEEMSDALYSAIRLGQVPPLDLVTSIRQKIDSLTNPCLPFLRDATSQRNRDKRQFDAIEQELHDHIHGLDGEIQALRERYTASQDAHQAREQELHDHIQGLDGKMQGLLENQLATEETLRVRQVQLDMSIRMLGVHGRTIARTLGPESCSKGWKGRHKKQVILDSRIFDAGYLAAQVSEFDLAPCELLDRYLSDPQLFKYSPNPLFDGGWYLERNPDVARSGINPLYHYLIHGHREKRSPHPLFDPEFYTHLYPDVLHAGVNPLIHYIRHGGAEGRRPHWLFDAAAYLQQFYQVVEANMTPLEHYCRYGGVISFRPHPYFDPDFYVISYADVLSTGLSPLVHYLRIGAGCGYDPSPEFSTEAYFAAYPETRANAVNPLIHFARQADYKRIFFGHDEGEVLVPPQRVSPQIKLQDIEAEQWSQPTSWLQDYLYEEFGFNERIRILTWLQNFGLPLNSAIKPDIENDNGLDLLANQVSVQARSLPVTDCPDISIIVPVYNQVRYTLACLHSILADKTRYNYEIIVADDNSSDGTPGYFSHGLVNVHHVRSPRNLGFLRNCNNAVNYARGRILVFLNNDTYVLPGWLDNLAGTLDSTAEVGLVGSKLVFADGRLQESGGLIFADGSGWNYGRLDDPRKPEYCYLRDTDYVSGASIAIPRALWDRLGGFSECYEMAYYEDTDLAFKVRDAGLRVVVQPLSQLIHFEGVSSGTDLTTGAKQYQVVNAKIFRQRWAGALASHGHADPAKLPINRNCRGRVLVIDTRTPMPDRDSGSMDTYQYLRMLKSFGFHVIFVPENLVHAGPYSDDLQRIGVETLYTPYWLSFEQIFSTLGPGLDYVLVFRAPLADSLLGLIRHHAPRARFIFDTVDLHFLRLEREAELADDAEKRRDAARMREIELNLMRKADATIVLSSYEMSLLSRLVPEANLHEIPIVRQAPPRSDKGFDERRDVVFVGGFEHTPNVDAVKWFIAEVMPHLQKRRFTGQFVVVGSSMPQEIRDLARPGIVMRGFVPDLEAFFGDIRVSVAPLRYGAGLKGKVISSLSYGVPVVATGVAVEGGGFTHGTDVWVADHPDDIAQAIIRLHEDRSEWEAYSAAGYSFFEDNFSVDVVSRKLATLFLGDTLSSSHNAQKIGQAA